MVRLKGEERGMREMRKHLLWYFRGFPEAKKIRKKLVTIQTLQEFKSVSAKLDANQQNHNKDSGGNWRRENWHKNFHSFHLLSPDS